MFWFRFQDMTTLCSDCNYFPHVCLPFWHYVLLFDFIGFVNTSLFMSFNSSPLSQLVEKGKTLHKHHCCPFLFGDWSSYPYQYITTLFIECLCVYALLTFIICSLAFIERVYTLNWMLSKFEVWTLFIVDLLVV